MTISDSYFSHPDKTYNHHIENIIQSFPLDDQHQICAIFHDLGKLSDAFQKYIQLKRSDFDSNELFEKARNKLKTTHALESAYLYFCNENKKETQFLANFFTILKHHSDLGDIENEIKEYISNLRVDLDRLSKIRAIAQNSNILFLEDTFVFNYFFKKQISKTMFNKKNFFLFKERYSRLILSDKFEAIFSESYQNVDVLTDETITKNLSKIESIIIKKQSEQPNTYRTKARDIIFDAYEICDSENKFLIKAPTGIGKTYIALELALKIAKKRKNKRRIITAIPFTSIIDQTHLEYEKILGNNSVLKYHHLTKYTETKEADEKEQFSQKVFLTDIWHEHFIVTTFNQLLYTFFSNHNRDNVRLETLRDSVIIIDEIQNIPRVLLKSVSFVINQFASRYNIDFVIMSATMPYIYEELQDFKELSDDSFYKEKNNRYVLSYNPKLNNYIALARVIKTEDQSVLCVVNTIEKAKKLHKEINKKDCYLLTTHQTPQHRKEIIKEISIRLAEGEKITLIATQLIEAGVDLDFDVGFREFAPFASIIQMAGRVNREGKHDDPCSVVVFDFIDVGRNEDAKKLPYHRTDLQEDEIKKILGKSLHEINLLTDMDDYFKALKAQTNSVDLERRIGALEFHTLFEEFRDNFMPNQPWKVSLFIEQKEGHFDKFKRDREKIFEDYENKFEALERIKELEKDLGYHTISINENLIKELKHNIDEQYGRYILKHGSDYYTKEQGFNLDLTIIEEAFS